MVFAYHLLWLAGIRNQSQLPFGWWIKACDAGVALFFCLSAYLLSQPLWQRLAAGNLGPGWSEQFLLRRVARIFPAYLIAVFFSFLFDDRTYTGWGLINLTLHMLALQTHFHQNFVWQVNSVLWTVSVEFQFYLFLAAAFWIGSRVAPLRRAWGLPLLLAISGVAMIADPIYRAIVTLLAPHVPSPMFGAGGDSAVYTWNVCYFLKWFIPGIAGGWLVSCIATDTVTRWAASRQWLLDLLFVALIGCVCFIIGNAGEGDWRTVSPLGWPLNVILFTSIILIVPHARVGRALFGVRTLVWFGTISFGLYLWHYVILTAINPTIGFSTSNGGTRVIALGIVGLAASAAVASLSYYLVEYRAISVARSCHSFRELYTRVRARSIRPLIGIARG
jgi:peptidoglycan/LPS O-acetylase OafA/YrhL